ncbi:putative ankyrin repeat protein [Cotonvirus japonicus]|uniref:Ankyrin repeat protein n=1 Tax=Cotonvirus japonicus TaxID=2811091 RepID=A0ABM7NR09_9VIRU|nr:putative ankyrin repeat protein [Cotonvirus japonicus]BCS82536.1 putative ankyrin repeat protein [Cotonvirus japonicus]
MSTFNETKFMENFSSKKRSTKKSSQSERISKKSKNTKSRVLTESERQKILTKTLKHSQKVSKKQTKILRSKEIIKKIKNQIDFDAINSTLKDDDVVINSLDDDLILNPDEGIIASESFNYLLRPSNSLEPESNQTDCQSREDVPCDSGFVCDEWSGGYFWVDFYATIPTFTPKSRGKWFLDDWDRGYYFQNY